MLIAIAVPLLFAHWALANFNPKPYGTAAIDGSDVEFFAPAGGSPVLIFAIAGLLLFGRVRRVAAGLGSTPHWSLGLGFLTGGAILQRWADYVGAPELLVLSLILLLLGSASLVAGRDGLRATWAPALFLIFAFPIPAIVVNSVIWPLQLQTASNASSFLGLIGYSPQKFADVIVLSGHSFQVIETCSGMRMIETLTMAASLYSILFFRRRSQVVVLMLAAPVIGYFVNFVRVISVIFNPYAEWATVHTAQGVIMLVV
ncbi:MAG: exosortase/archaeosortase family protein, partial [Myxococcales bacterium]